MFFTCVFLPFSFQVVYQTSHNGFANGVLALQLRFRDGYKGEVQVRVVGKVDRFLFGMGKGFSEWMDFITMVLLFLEGMLV
jgi:hypothetical protein